MCGAQTHGTITTVHAFVNVSRIQLPKSVRTMKKMEKTIPLSFTPPCDSMPSYITTFQSSPVRIYRGRKGQRSTSLVQMS